MGGKAKTKESLQNFTLKTIPITQIKRAKYNPRREFTEAELKSFETDMEQFSCVLPLVWNSRTGNLIGGHKRLDWLEKKGAKTVRVAVVNLNEKEEKLLNLALNRQGEGLWNERELELVLSELSIEGLDLKLTGFEIDPITMEPKIASAIVTSESIKKAEEDLRDIAKRTRDQSRVVCPGCGMEFYIDKEDNE